jgi:hypothetical protein
VNPEGRARFRRAPLCIASIWIPHRGLRDWIAK